MSISWTRRSYEAAVLLIPLDRDARAALDARGDDALVGITIGDAALLTERPDDVAHLGQDDASSTPLELAVHEADIVLVHTHDLSEVDRAAVARIGDAARSTGKLLGAVVVSPQLNWSDAASYDAATTLREVADNVVVLSDVSLAVPFFEVLRGGTRDGELAGAAS